MANCDDESCEVIITSNTNNVTIYKSQSLIKTYKNSDVPPKCLALMGGGEYMGAAVTIKPELRIWNVRNPKECQNNLIGSVNVLTATSCGSFIVAALKSEIRIWNIHNGEMLTSFKKHYQDVSCLCFNSDDSILISGGSDGFVFVWIFTGLIQVNADPEKVSPLYTWNNHTKAVSDIFVGYGGLACRVATSSLDMTCNLYQLENGLLLSTVYLESPIKAVVMDILDICLIVGTETGWIHKVNLTKGLPREMHSNSMEKEDIHAHEAGITCLSMNDDSEKFLSASLDCTLKVWDFNSLSIIFVITSTNGPFQNAFFKECPFLLYPEREPDIIISDLQRSYLPYNERRHDYKAKPLTLSSIEMPKDTELGFENFLPIDVFEEEEGQRPVVRENKEKSEKELFGENMNEVREINHQLYTHIIEQLKFNIDNMIEFN